MPNNRILIADDEPDIGEVIAEIAEDIGFEVTYVQDGDKVVGRVAAVNPAAILLDLRMPGADGVEILRELSAQGCTARIVLISGMDQRTLNTVESLGREKDLDIVGTLTKPMHPDQIEEMLTQLQGNPAQAVKEMPATATETEARFGPCVYFSAQALLSNDNRATGRAALEGRWKLDNGEELRGAALAKWSRDQGIAKGLLAQQLQIAMKHWQRLGESGNSVKLVLPLSPIMLEDMKIIDVLVDVTRQASFPVSNLVIETIESGVNQAGSNALDVLSRMRIAGFKTAFITESDADELLTMIDKLPMDEIVVDTGFLYGEKGITSNMELEFSYSSLTSLARKKGIETSAMNVTSQEILEFVTRCQFDWAEGQQVAAPLPISNLLNRYS